MFGADGRVLNEAMDPSWWFHSSVGCALLAWIVGSTGAPKHVTDPLATTLHQPFGSDGRVRVCRMTHEHPLSPGWWWLRTGVGCVLECPLVHLNVSLTGAHCGSMLSDHLQPFMGLVYPMVMGCSSRIVHRALGPQLSTNGWRSILESSDESCGLCTNRLKWGILASVQPHSHDNTSQLAQVWAFPSRPLR